jgi:hypothetical protein
MAIALARTAISIAIVNINIEGPCCHNARLAVDQTGAQYANTNAITIDPSWVR